MKQYAFNIALPVAYATEQYIVSESNRLAYDWVVRWPAWPTFALYVQGEKGAGKTHLAHIWQAKAKAAFLPVDSSDLPKSATIVDGLEQWKNEQAFFHLFNHCKLGNIPLLITSEHTPDALSFILPDVKSRLKSLPLAPISPPDDTLLTAVFLKQLSDRQLKVAPDVVSYVLPRLPRSFAALSELVAKLDNDSLASGRTLTIPFIRPFL